ncbi:UBX domain-containing protein 1, partial [Pseudolycoriella hygida]
MSDLEALMAMGFPEERAEEALIETGCSGIDTAVEYLLVTTTADSAPQTSVEEKYLPESVQDNTIQSEIDEASNSSAMCTDRGTDADKSTRILVRLINGKTMSRVFNSQDKLRYIVNWVKLNSKTVNFGLMTNFPKKIFVEEDYNLTLQQLNLIPSAVLIVTNLEDWDDLKCYTQEDKNDKIRKVEEKRRKEEVDAQMKKLNEDRLALARVRAQIEDDKAARRFRWPNLYDNPNEPSGNQLQNVLQGLPRPRQVQGPTRPNQSTMSHTYSPGKCPYVQPIPDFDMTKFLGRWYAIEKTSTESSCLIYNFKKDVEEGEFLLEQTSERYPTSLNISYIFDYTGYLKAGKNSSKMVINFPLNIVGSSSFDVVMTDYKTYAGIFTCQNLFFLKRQSVTFLSRTNKLDKELLTKMRNLFEQNIGNIYLNTIRHDNCNEASSQILLKVKSHLESSINFSQSVTTVPSMTHFITNDKKESDPRGPVKYEITESSNAENIDTESDDAENFIDPRFSSDEKNIK